MIFRDLIEKTLLLHKHNVSLVDTAGIHDSKDEIEKEGVNKSTQMLEKANLVLFVDDKDPIKSYKNLGLQAKNIIYIINKIDLFPSLALPAVFCQISCKSGQGIKELSTKISTEIKKITDILYESKKNFITLRQKNQIHRFLLKITETLAVLKETDDMAIVASYLHRSHSILCEINRPAHNSEVVNNVFKEFCVGK